MTLGNSLGQLFPDNHCGLSTVYTKVNDTLNLTAEIEFLKVEIVELKSENERKIKELESIHLLELEDLNKGNISIINILKKIHDNNHIALVEAHTEEVNGLKFQNEQLKRTLAFKESLDVALVSKDKDLVKLN